MARISPKFPRVRGRRWTAMHGAAAHRGLMTAASIIWSFWANGQITGERRDYCYYTRPRTQSKPDYTLVSQSLSALLFARSTVSFALGSPARDGGPISFQTYPIPHTNSPPLSYYCPMCEWVSKSSFLFFSRIWTLGVFSSRRKNFQPIFPERKSFNSRKL